jgi:ribosomal protein S18 acetylase RimI-like enzyme
MLRGLVLHFGHSRRPAKVEAPHLEQTATDMSLSRSSISRERAADRFKAMAWTNEEPSRLRFRPARDDDLPDVLELFRESTSGVLHAAWGEKAVRERLKSRETSTGIQSCTVVEYGGAVIGHEISYPDAARSSNETTQSEAANLLRPFRLLRLPDSWYLSSIAVSLDHRRRGIGSRLLHASALKAAAAGYESLSLHVFAEKKPALGLYALAGMSEVQRTTIPPHAGVTADSELLLQTGWISQILTRLGPMSV